MFDPATYYGHNEAEFGMSWCAGFSDAFYDAYHETFPKTEERFEERRLLYRLYHYLNHYNLFGGGYKRQCVEIENAPLRGSVRARYHRVARIPGASEGSERGEPAPGAFVLLS